MFKIGDFSKLSRVPVKTLRYYDEIDLFQPDHVDQFTGYRYYSVEQLPRLNRILALRNLGFTLKEIAELISGDLPPEQIRGMLQMKQSEIEQHLEAEHARLALVEARLRQIEQENTMSEYDVVIKEIEAQKIASVRETLENYGQAGMLLGKLMMALGQSGGQPIGAPLCLYHDPEYKEKDVDVEAAIPVAGNVTGGNGLTVRELSGGTVASTIHKGSFDKVGEAYTAVAKWIEANNYEIADCAREIYLKMMPDMPEEEFLTEIQWPVKPAKS
ncbi:MAG: MerR family transcriptional regulator [Anaerolineae bacterium]|nr:MerR family transcriptional regulator [Anaerolineae bacterium]